MAEAVGDTSTSWVTLFQAREHLAGSGSRRLAEKRLVRQLAGGLRWFYLFATHDTPEGVKVERAAGSIEGDAAIWHSSRLDIDWNENRVCEGGRCFHAITILLEDLKVRDVQPRYERQAARVGMKSDGPQVRRVLRVLPQLFPPEGKVPDEVPTETVRGQVAKVLESENRRLGLRNPGWDSVRRALGRDL
jgi:hypothetical protein